MTENNPAKNASAFNTPRVGPTRSVEVDDLRWSLNGHPPVTTADALPTEARILERIVANGVFVVASLSVTDHKSESVTLTNDVVSLVAGNKTYSVDRRAEARLSGHTLLAEELGPNVSDDVEAVFDVAPEVLHEHPELRFNELGFGATHGYVILPQPLPSSESSDEPTPWADRLIREGSTGSGGAAPVLNVGPVPGRAFCTVQVNTDLVHPDCPAAERIFSQVVTNYETVGEIPAHIGNASCDLQGYAVEFVDEEVVCAPGSASFTVYDVESMAGTEPAAFFASPSGNVECELRYNRETRAGTAHCGTRLPQASVTMSSTGALKTCSGLGCEGNGPVNQVTLPYGKSTQLGPFRCLSSEAAGIACTVTGGKGFGISRSGVHRIGG